MGVFCNLKRMLGVLLMVPFGLMGTSDVNASESDSCINFLNAQDYVRAKSVALQLLQRTDLQGEETHETYLCLGMAYIRTGFLQEGLNALKNAEATTQNINKLALVYSLLGPVYLNLGDFDQAEVYTQRALKVFRNSGDKVKEAAALLMLGSISQKRGNLQDAYDYYQEVLSLLPEARQASALNGMATVHIERKEYKRAISILRKVIEISRRNGEAHITALAQSNLGTALRKSRQYAAAEKELLAALNTLRLLGDKRLEAATSFELAELASEAKIKPQALDALEWYERAESLYRKIGDVDSANQVVQLLIKKGNDYVR